MTREDISIPGGGRRGALPPWGWAVMLAGLAAAPAGLHAGGGGGGAATWGETEMPPGLSMALEPVDGAGLRAVIRNEGPGAVTLALDPRLVVLELGEGRRRLRCSPPDELDLPDLEGAELRTLEPGGTADLPLDLRYHCWGRLARLGNEVTAMAAAAELLVVPVEDGAAVGRSGVLRGETEIGWPLAGDGAEAEAAEPLEVTTQGADVTDRSALRMAVRVRNRGGTALRLVDHPTQFRFEVSGPGGAWVCGMHAWNIRPLSDLLVRLRPGGSYRRTIEMGLYCPREAFERPGVYRVVPVYGPYLASRAAEPVLDREVRGSAVEVRIRRGGER